MKLRKMIFTAMIVLQIAALGGPASATIAGRQRDGVGLWTPRSGSFTAYVSSDPIKRMNWQFYYNNSRNMVDNWGYQRAYEMKAELPDGTWANDYDSVVPYFSHNLPSSSIPYVDTQASDRGPEETFGWGILYPVYLTFQVNYTSTVGVKAPSPGAPNTSGVKVFAKPGYKAFPDCAGSLCLNLCPGTFCVFTDYSQIIVAPGQATTGTTKLIPGNFLNNDGFENGNDSPYIFWPGMNHVVFNDSRSWQGGWHIQFNKSSAVASSIRQDVPFPPANFNYTVEAAVRCPSYNGSSCPINLVYWGIGGGYPNESRETGTISLPANDLWYVCRLDSNHGTAGIRLNNPHSTLRMELYVNGTHTLLADYLMLSQQVVYIKDPAPLNPDGPIPDGPTCTQRDY